MSRLPKSIMVPTDFSETAEHALRFAQHLALDFGAELHLVHVQVLLEGQEQDEAAHQEIGPQEEPDTLAGRVSAFSQQPSPP